MDDWYKYGSDDMYEFKKIKAKQCEESDFCKGKQCTEDLASYFSDWGGLSIVCPVLDDDFSGFNILGDPSKMIQNMMVFNMKKCQDEDMSNCPDDLDEFLTNVTVEVWAIYEKIYFDKRFEKPVFNTMELISQSKVTPD